MKNFYQNVINVAKYIIVPMLLAIVGLDFLYLIFTLCTVFTPYASVATIISMILEVLFTIGIFVFLTYCWIAGKKHWFKLTYVIYISYQLMLTLFTFVLECIVFEYGTSMGIVCQVFNLFLSLAILAVGGLVLADCFASTNRFKNIVNYILMGIMCWLVIIFILNIVYIAVDGYTWSEILTPILDFAFVALFMGLYNFNDSTEEVKPLDAKSNNESAEEPVKE